MTSPGERSARPHAIRVLVVDDEGDMARLWARALALRGFEVRAAYDTASALMAAEAIEPDVAMLDIHLGVEDGQDLGLELRRRIPALRLIAMTGDERLALDDRSQLLGFDAHLVKPIELHDVVRLVGMVAMFGVDG